MANDQLYQQQLDELQRRETLANKNLADALGRASEAYHSATTRIAEDREQLETHKDEPVVMVNAQTRQWYHSADAPCGRVTGWGRYSDNFLRMFISVARTKGYKPCSACGYRALHEFEKMQEPPAGETA